MFGKSWCLVGKATGFCMHIFLLLWIIRHEFNSYYKQLTFSNTYRMFKLSRAENEPLSRKVSLFEERSLYNERVIYKKEQ